MMPSNGKSNEYSSQHRESESIFIEAWREAADIVLAEIRADHQKVWARERELIEAQARTLIAELRAEIAEQRVALKALFDDRLALLRDGIDGKDGCDGEKGEKGDKGDAGEKGQAGDEGSRGEKGERGESGEKGERGEQGSAGPCGPSGAIGPPGPIGPRGEPGEIGLGGAQGVAGPPGERGPPGDRGETGLAGPPGAAGERGPIGSPGEKGAPGAPGERGAAGPPGRLSIAGVYQPGKIHYEGYVGTHEGATWQALRDTAHSPPHEDWSCLARAGVDARMPVARGTFDPEVNYAALDIVALNGGSFMARRDDPGACPGDGWQLVARQGQRGTAGERGSKGEPGGRGPQGERGDRGPQAPRMTGWKIDREKYTATPIMSDGSACQPLELRTLFLRYQEETA